jgi:hypothetical protein
MWRWGEVQKAADWAGYALSFVERFTAGVGPRLAAVRLGYAGCFARREALTATLQSLLAPHFAAFGPSAPNRAARLVSPPARHHTLGVSSPTGGQAMIDEMQAPQQPGPIMAWKDVLTPLAWAAGAVFVLVTKEGQQLPWWMLAAAVVVAVVAPLVALVYGLGAAKKWTPDHASDIAFKTVAWIIGAPLAIWAGYSLLTSAQRTLHDIPPWAGAIIGLQVYTLFVLHGRKSEQ